MDNNRKHQLLYNLRLLWEKVWKYNWLEMSHERVFIQKKNLRCKDFDFVGRQPISMEVHLGKKYSKTFVCWLCEFEAKDLKKSGNSHMLFQLNINLKISSFNYWTCYSGFNHIYLFFTPKVGTLSAKNRGAV